MMCFAAQLMASSILGVTLIFLFGSQVKNPGKKHHVKFHKVCLGSISAAKTWAIKMTAVINLK